MRPAVAHDDVTQSGTIVAGNEIRYLQAGEEGPPVILLHGGIVDAAHLSWGEVIGPLAEGHRVYALDLLGYGYSDKPPGPYTTQRHVDVVEGFMGVEGIDSAHLVGVSLGGGVATGLALQSPERVDHLVAADAFGLGTELPNGALTYLASRLGVLNRLSLGLLRRHRGLAEKSLGNVVADPEDLPDELVDAFFEHLQEPGVGKAYRSWRKQEVAWGGFETYYYTRLDELESPALFLHGEEDEIFPPRWSERAADAAPDGRVELYDDCGHWLPREAPDRFNEDVVAFLRE